MDIEIELSQLGPQLKRLVRAIGVPATLRLLAARGGTRLKLPLKPEGECLRFLAESDLSKLIAEFEAGTDLWLPMDDKINAQLRNASIRADYAAGVSRTQLALTHHLTIRQILNIVSETGPIRGAMAVSGQGSLFSGD